MRRRALARRHPEAEHCLLPREDHQYRDREDK
jgi:hypothetical protein